MISLYGITYSQERVYKELNYKITSDDMLSDINVFRPNLLDINKNNEIVFFDFIDFKIVKKDIIGQEYKFFGDGRGRGPKEFEMVFDLKVLDNGEIFLVDSDKRKIIKWDTKGEYLGEMESGGKRVSPARMAVCESSDVIYILSSQFSRKGIMHQVNKKGDLMLSFEKKKNFEKSLPFYTDGELDCGSDGSLFYASRYVNSIKKYDKFGSLVFDIPVIDFLANEKIVERNDNFFDLVKGVKRASGDVIHFDDKLYVAFSGQENELLSVIDVYSGQNGKYEHSFKLPFSFQEVAMNARYIIVLREGENGENYLTTLEY